MNHISVRCCCILEFYIFTKKYIFPRRCLVMLGVCFLGCACVRLLGQSFVCHLGRRRISGGRGGCAWAVRVRSDPELWRLRCVVGGCAPIVSGSAFRFHRLAELSDAPPLPASRSLPHFPGEGGAGGVGALLYLMDCPSQVFAIFQKVKFYVLLRDAYRLLPFPMQI